MDREKRGMSSGMRLLVPYFQIFGNEGIKTFFKTPNLCLGTWKFGNYLHLFIVNAYIYTLYENIIKLKHDGLWPRCLLHMPRCQELLDRPVITEVSFGRGVCLPPSGILGSYAPAYLDKLILGYILSNCFHRTFLCVESNYLYFL